MASRRAGAAADEREPPRECPLFFTTTWELLRMKLVPQVGCPRVAGATAPAAPKALTGTAVSA
eukprot:7486780-Pyramimonas_sp.AAC.1